MQLAGGIYKQYSMGVDGRPYYVHGGGAMDSRTSQYSRTGEFPEECFIKEILDEHFNKQGFQRIETNCVDYVCEHPDSGDRWHIEAHGASAAIGLDFRLSLGQLIRGISHRNTRYALAFPDLPQYRNQIRNIEPWVCKALNLHWLLVDQEGRVIIIEPKM